MAIQNRRGDYNNFDPTKQVAGEFAVVLQNDPNVEDGKAVYITFGEGNVKRLATRQEVEGLVTQAQTAATNAENSADDSASSATDSSGSATLAESYAKGGTNTRTGEDTDNAKYYKEQCDAVNEEMQEAIERIEPSFSYDPTTGHLSYTDSVVVFSYNQSNGHLSWGMGA